MPKRILVADDDSGILDAVSLVLGEEGYEVETAPRSEDVHLKVKTFQPHLILQDVLMSGDDGREICQKLKSSDKTKSIPVIMISAHPTVKDGISKFGADDFLAKPFQVEELLETIKKHII
jgi:DNA-binding response OmpR family regulator